MRSTLIFLTMLLLTGCASEYNQIRFKAGITVPLPIMPIDVGVTLELKDALEESLTDEEIFQQLVDDAALERLLNEAVVVPDPTTPDGVRIDAADQGIGNGHPEDSGSGSGESRSDIPGSGEDDRADS